MTSDEFKMVLTNVVSDLLRPIHERLEAIELNVSSIELNVSNAISRMNVYVERRVAEMQRASAPPDAE